MCTHATPTHTLAQIQILKLTCILSLKVTEHKQHLECCLQKNSCFYGFCEEPFPSLARTLCQKGVLRCFTVLFGSSGCWLKSTPALCEVPALGLFSNSSLCVYLFPLPEYIWVLIQLITTQLHLCWEPADRKHSVCSWEGTHWHP